MTAGNPDSVNPDCTHFRIIEAHQGDGWKCRDCGMTGGGWVTETPPVKLPSPDDEYDTGPVPGWTQRVMSGALTTEVVTDDTPPVKPTPLERAAEALRTSGSELGGYYEWDYEYLGPSSEGCARVALDAALSDEDEMVRVAHNAECRQYPDLRPPGCWHAKCHVAAFRAYLLGGES